MDEAQQKARAYVLALEAAAVAAAAARARTEWLDLGTFRRRFGAVQDAVFASPVFAAATASPFRDATWIVLALPGGQMMEDRYLRCLAHAATVHSGPQVVMVDAEGVREPDGTPINPSAEVVAWDDFDAAINGVVGREEPRAVTQSLLHVLDVYLLGQSPTWGALCIDDVALVAGTPAFTTDLANPLGGVERLRTEFVEFAAGPWHWEERGRQLIRAWTGWNEIPPWIDPCPDGRFPLLVTVEDSAGALGAAGLRTGDLVIGTDGAKFRDERHVKHAFRPRAGRSEVKLLVSRDGQHFDVTIPTAGLGDRAGWGGTIQPTTR